MNGQKKASIIYVLKVLEEYSDVNHLLTHQQIIDKIYQKYDLLLERKSIANSIALLEELGYDICKGERGGFYLLSRLFDQSEISFLIDAIYSSKVITATQAKELSKTISSTLSRYERKQYSYIHKSAEINRNINSDFFFNIELINEAINSNKKISFQYISYDTNGKETLRYNGYNYIVSPYYLINNFGKYYMLCHYYKWQDRTVFRVDYMRNIKILDDDREDIRKIGCYGPNFDISQYINNHIYIFGGKTITAKIKIKHEWSITNVIDWFGDNATIYNKEGQLYADIKCDDKAIFYWCLQYSPDIELISPVDLRDKLIRTLKDVLDTYNNNPILYIEDELDLKELIFDFNHNLYLLEKNLIYSQDKYQDAMISHIKKLSLKEPPTVFALSTFSLSCFNVYFISFSFSPCRR